jgi:hypothetical protein
MNNLPKYWNSSNVTSPYLLEPSKLLSPELNKLFGAGTVDGTLDGLMRRVFPNLPPKPSLVRQHGVQDAVELTEMFNKGKMHVDLGNLERGRPPVTNSAMWGLDDWNNPNPRSAVAKYIHEASQPDYAAMSNASAGSDFVPFMGKLSALLDGGELINALKSPKIAELFSQNEKTIEKNKKNDYMLPAVAAGLGGVLPAASLGQYWLNDYGKIRNTLENIPIYSPKDLQNKIKPGDIGMTGPVDFNAGSGLGNASKFISGSPVGHGVGVGKYKKIHQVGALGGELVNIPENYRYEGTNTVLDHYGNLVTALKKGINTKNKTLIERLGIVQKHMNKTKQVREKLLSKVDRPDVAPVKKLENLRSELAPRLNSKDDEFAMMFRNEKLSPRQTAALVKKLEKLTVLPYSLSAGVSTGLGRVASPKIKGVPEVACTETMCGDNVGAANKMTGKGYRGRALPSDVFLNPDFAPVGVATSRENMSPAKLRKVMLASLSHAAKQRTKLGLGATGLGMAGGAGLGMLGNMLENKIKSLYNQKNKEQTNV